MKKQILRETLASDKNYLNDHSVSVAIDADTISRSEIGSNRKCMIATALREQLGAWSVEVSSDSIRFNIGGERTKGQSPADGQRHSYRTPAGARAKIFDFDDEKEVTPFTLVLKPSDHTSGALKNGVKHQKKSHTKRCQTVACNRTICTKRRYHGQTIVERVLIAA